MLKHIDEIRSLPPQERSNDRMCSCYVFAFGALEYMVETLIQGWVQSNARKHKPRYKGKASVNQLLEVLNDYVEKSIIRNNGFDYNKICYLIERLAGQQRHDQFQTSVAAHPGGANALIAAISQITKLRHNVAHGKFWPDEVSPNLDELETAFLSVYDVLIVGLNDTLPRY